MRPEYAPPTAASSAAHKPFTPKPATAPGLPLFLQREPAAMFSGPTPAPYPSKGYLIPKHQPGTQFDTLLLQPEPAPLATIGGKDFVHTERRSLSYRAAVYE